MEKRTVIIGAGPTGLGAAYRLNEVGCRNWNVYEAKSYVGGLSASIMDDKGFIWDIGGHVMFSHFDYYDKAYERVMKGDYFTHKRESYIWITDRFIRYPFQNNIKRLSEEIALECVMELMESHYKTREKPKNFYAWIQNHFGKGIARYFMIPYNQKVWAHPLEMMDFNWINERINIINPRSVILNLLREKDDHTWGPNEQFRFPRFGGTGELWRRFAKGLNGELHLESPLVSIDPDRKVVIFEDRKEDHYDLLISTMPLNKLANCLKSIPDKIRNSAASLRFNSVLVVGVGIAQKCPSKKNWIYFPQSDSPFYRVTYLSNYSHNLVPNGSSEYYSLLCEISYSEYKPENKDFILEKTIQGLINSKILNDNDIKQVVATKIIEVDQAYPIPTIDRDTHLKICREYLEARDIYSRGRFGAWKYEAGNMDHSFMQGVEVVNKILFNEKETVVNGR